MNAALQALAATPLHLMLKGKPHILRPLTYNYTAAMDAQCFTSVQKAFVSLMDELETSSVHPCNASSLAVRNSYFIMNVV